jgi:Ca2+-binding RTX toxin-like protein
MTGITWTGNGWAQQNSNTDTSGDDYLNGLGGNDTLTGGAGNDTLIGGTGNDSLIGGAGDDVYEVDSTSDKVVEDTVVGGVGGNDTVNFKFTNTKGTSMTLFAGVENAVVTGSYADTITGNGLANIITGNAAANKLIGAALNDTLLGGEGNDILVGDSLTATGAAVGTGNDVLDGGTGVDTLYGGNGDDTYVLDDVKDLIVEDSITGSGTDVANYTLLKVGQITIANNVEVVNLLDTLADTVVGNDLVNSVFANGAANLMDLKGGADVVYAGGGHDTVLGGAGNDTIYGEAGNDSLDGGLDNDLLVGGLGDDIYVVDSLGDVVKEDTLTGSGNDTIQYKFTLTSGTKVTLDNNVESGKLLDTFNDTLMGNASGNTLLGNTGNNLIDGGMGNDTIDGGGGQDTLRGSAGLDSLVGRAGNDLLDGGADSDTMVGGIGSDYYLVDNFNDVVIEATTDTGRDTVEATSNFSLATTNSAGIEVLIFKGSADLMGKGNDLANEITGNGGNNRLQGGLGNDVIDGGAGNDDLDGEAGQNKLIGGDGDDRLHGNTDADSDILIGGIGADTYFIGAADVLYELAKDNIAGEYDTVYSTASFDASANANVMGIEDIVLTGGTDDALNATGNGSDNYIIGSVGTNVIKGLDGNDTLFGDLTATDTASDTLIGGAGSDTYYIGANDVVIETAGPSVIAGEVDTVISALTFDASTDANRSGIENIQLTGSAAVNASGNALNNLITGNNVANVLNGNAGADILDGGLGSDTLNGGAGADTMIGGKGNDTYYVDSVDDVIIDTTLDQTLSSGISDQVYSSVSYSLADADANGVELLYLVGVDNINGTANDRSNYVEGNQGDNIIDGGLGDDYLFGMGGDDELLGGAGDDDIDGGLGKDELLGGEGDDYIDGGLDNDRAFGGAGNDTLNGGGDEDFLYGDEGDDLLMVEGSRPSYMGGGSGHDTLLGDIGSDWLDGGTDADLMVGGRESDEYYIDNRADIVVEQPDEGLDTVHLDVAPAADGSRFAYDLGANFENVIMEGTFSIDATGNAQANTLIGNSGVNVLKGGDGTDWLSGGGVAPELRFGPLGVWASDTLIGGSGDDIYSIDEEGAVVIARDNESNDASGHDRLEFLAVPNYLDVVFQGVSKYALWFEKANGSDLNISVLNGATPTSTATLANWFDLNPDSQGLMVSTSGLPYPNQELISYLHGNDIARIVASMAQFSPVGLSATDITQASANSTFGALAALETEVWKFDL